MSETFLAQLQQHFASVEIDAMSLFREKGWQQFLRLGLPKKAEDSFRYVPLRELYSFSFALSAKESVDKSVFENAILPECKHSHLIFVNGRFTPELSDFSALPKQAVVLSLSEAMRSHASFLQNHLERALKEEQDPFAWLNLALHSEGAFFYLPPKTVVDVPVQCLHVLTGESAFPCLYIVQGAQSQMRWITTYSAADVSHLLTPMTKIFLEEGARLDLLAVADAMPLAWHLESVRAVLKKNARLHSLSVTTGSKAMRQSYRVQLKGEGSEADLNGLWMLNKNRTAHTHAIVDHEAPHTHSMQRFKGVLNDTSQSSFEGKILVRDVAQKTEAYQLNKNLILSQGAIANSKPNLEVFADDVKASHGATVSQLDEEQLFYLGTRGIDKATAKQLLVFGFCREMIAQISYPGILQRLQRHIDGSIS